MEPLEQKIKELEAKVTELESSVKKIKTIFYWFLAISIALVILPLFGLIFVIPQFLSTYGGALEGL